MNFFGFQEDRGLIINIFITGKCNARCRECINQIITNNSKFNPEELEVNIERDVKIIKAILEKHSDLCATICFYGGEPLLESHKFIPVIDGLKEAGYDSRTRYMIYTNGELLAQFFEEYSEIANSIWLYAVSIDGDEAQHNRFRVGTDLKRIRNNLEFVVRKYRGNILMWSTLREEQSLLNCFEEFIELYNSGLVNHFFWHWLETQEEFKNFSDYHERYIADLTKIVDYYIGRLKQGELLPIAHLNELILYLITKKQRNHTACGAELPTNYDLVSGEVLACIDLPFEQGRDLKKNPGLISILKSNLGCTACKIHYYCGGRCPVQILCGTNVRTKRYCELLRSHVRTIEQRLPEIRNMFEKNNFSLQYVYDRSAFIVRYTDVTP